MYSVPFWQGNSSGIAVNHVGYLVVLYVTVIGLGAGQALAAKCQVSAFIVWCFVLGGKFLS